MAVDFAALATRLLENARANGLARVVTLLRLDVTPPDPAMPWRGPVNPRAAPSLILAGLTAAFVEPSSQQQLGLNAELVDWLPRAQQIAIIAHPSDLTQLNVMLDGVDEWRVVGVSTLRPGPTRIVHFVGVSR